MRLLVRLVFFCRSADAGSAPAQFQGGFHTRMLVLQRYKRARIRALIMACCWPLLLLYLIAGCDEADEFGSEHLIRVGDRVVTVYDFNKAFELTETAHSFGLRDHPEQFREAQKRLLNQMTVELLMLARAAELNLTISAEELDSKIEDIKADYPDDTFEETLLESAVPFDVWKQRLKIRLLVEKLIAAELQNQMTITPKDITEHYQKYFKSKSADGSQTVQKKGSAADHEAIIRDLRRRKAEEAYDAWVAGLKTRYSVEVNAAAWEKMTAEAEQSAKANLTESSDKK